MLDAATCRAKLKRAAAKRGITVDPNDSACELLVGPRAVRQAFVESGDRPQ